MKNRKILILVVTLLFLTGLLAFYGIFSYLHCGNPDFNPILRNKNKVVRIWVNDAWDNQLICYTAFENKLGEWIYYKYRSTVLNPKRWGWEFNFTFIKRRHRYFHKNDPRWADMVDDPMSANMFHLSIRSSEYTEILFQEVSGGINEKEIKSGLLDGYIQHVFLKNNERKIRFMTYNLQHYPEKRNLLDLFSLLAHIDFMLDHDSGYNYNQAIERNAEMLRSQHPSS